VTETVRAVLDNGLTVLLCRTTHAPVATFWMWYRVGSRDEEPGRTGASHWVEHMLFKGTERFPKGELDRLVAREGGAFNGMTWLDWTAYLVTLPAQRIDLALDIEADRMTNAVFDPREVASERSVIVSEREGHENSPMFRLMEKVQSTAIKIHPYRHEVIGRKRDILSVTRDDLWRHYRRYYRPSNAIAVAVGAIEVDAMLGRIAERFGGIAAVPEPAPLPPREPRQRRERRLVVKGDDPTSFLAVAFPAPAATDADFFAFQVMSTVLGGAPTMNLFGCEPPNRSSRLYRALVETGLATAVSCDMVARIDPYLYTLTAVVRHGVDPSAVEAIALSEVQRLAHEPLTPAELSRAKKQARAQFAYASERVTDLGFWLGFAEIVADQSWYDTYPARLETVSADDVLSAARTWLSPNRRTVGHYVPDPRMGAHVREDEDAGPTTDDCACRTVAGDGHDARGPGATGDGDADPAADRCGRA
jgi:zinc protease